MSVPHLERLRRECERSDTTLVVLPGAAAAARWAESLRARLATDVDGEGFSAVQVVRAAALIAETGSAVLHGRSHPARGDSLRTRNLILLIERAQIYADLGAYLSSLDPATLHDALGSHLTLLTGPSRTADIEKVLVVPAHGPARLWLGIVDEDAATPRAAQNE